LHPDHRPLSPRERGTLGARTRWGPPRIVRLDQLDSDTARLIRALLAQTETASPVSETSGNAADAEVHGNARSAA
jgi:hypothetical protein